MARNDTGRPVGGAGTSHCPRRFGCADALGDFAIATGLAGRDFSQCFPDLPLEGRAEDGERYGRRVERLTAAGLSEEQIGRIAAPIGLDIGAETPEEIAVSIVGELLTIRLGGTGRPLSEVSRVAFTE